MNIGTSSSSSSSEAGCPMPTQRTESGKVGNDNGNDNDNQDVTVNVAAMGDFALGVGNEPNASADYEKLVAHLVVNHTSVEGVKNPNVLVVDEVALEELVKTLNLDSGDKAAIEIAAYNELQRRTQELENGSTPTVTTTTTTTSTAATPNTQTTSPSNATAQPAAAAAQPGAAIVQGWLTQQLTDLHATLLAHKRAFAVVAGIAAAVVVGATSGAIFFAAMGEEGWSRHYEFREFNYSRGEELYSVTHDTDGYRSRDAFERSMRDIAARAWNSPNEYAFDPRESPSEFDVLRKFNTTGPKLNGTTTLVRFDLTEPSQLRAAYDGTTWGPAGFVMSETVLAIAVMVIVYNVIMQKFK